MSKRILVQRIPTTNPVGMLLAIQVLIPNMAHHGAPTAATALFKRYKANSLIRDNFAAYLGYPPGEFVSTSLRVYGGPPGGVIQSPPLPLHLKREDAYGFRNYNSLAGQQIHLVLGRDFTELLRLDGGYDPDYWIELFR